MKMKSKLFLFFVLALAGFLRLYKMNSLMNFGGDVARDYLTARDITLQGVIPLVGCPSSVPWLHQGALFTYILGIVLWIGKYNPLAGGYFVGTLGVLGVLGIFLLGRKLFSKEAGLWAALFYATSPLVVIFDRYPYHQSLISIFTMAFIYSLYLGLRKPLYFILSSFLFGLLMQLELSNLVFLPVIVFVVLAERKKISIKNLVFCFFAFLFTWIPKFIYDFSNGWTQTFGFAAWVMHKLIPIKFIGDNPSISLPFFQRFIAIFNQLSKMIFWQSTFVSAIIFVSLTIFFLSKSKILKESLKDSFRGSIKKSGEFLIGLWLVFPFLGFLLHGSPSAGYVPVLFALPPLLVGYLIWQTGNKILKTVFSLGAIFLIVFNGFFLLKTNFLTLTGDMKQEMARNYPQSYRLFSEMAKYIVSDSAGKLYSLMAMGEFAAFPSNIDTLRYLNWYFGNPVSEKKEKTRYLIYYNFDEERYNSIKGERKKFPFMTVVRQIGVR